MKVVTQAETLFLQALTEHEGFVSGIVATRKRGFNSGIGFVAAKQLCQHGEWEELCAAHSDKISLRTIQRYAKFASDCLILAKEQNPKIMHRAKLEVIARDMVLESALSFMELCRSVGCIKSRDGEGARDGKAGRERQTEFHFNYDVFDGFLSALDRTEGNPFSSVNRQELLATRGLTVKALAMIDAVLSPKS